MICLIYFTRFITEKRDRSNQKKKKLAKKKDHA